MASDQAIEDNIVSVTKAIGSSAQLALRIGQPALPIIEFWAGFFPGAAPIVQVLSIALPILEKVAAGAPVVAEAIDQNRPVIGALIDAAPNITDHLKQLYEIATTADGKAVAAAQVTEQMLHEFVTKPVFARSFFAPQDPRFDRVSAEGFS